MELLLNSNLYGIVIEKKKTLLTLQKSDSIAFEKRYKKYNSEKKKVISQL